MGDGMLISAKIAIAQNKLKKIFFSIAFLLSISILPLYIINNDYQFGIILYIISCIYIFILFIFAFKNIKSIYKEILQKKFLIFLFPLTIILIHLYGLYQSDKIINQKIDEIQDCIKNISCKEKIQSQKIAVTSFLTNIVIRVYVNNDCIYIWTIPEMKRFTKECLR